MNAPYMIHPCSATRVILLPPALSILRASSAECGEPTNREQHVSSLEVGQSSGSWEETTREEESQGGRECSSAATGRTGILERIHENGDDQ